MALSRRPTITSARVDPPGSPAIFRRLREAGRSATPPRAPVAELVDALDSKSSSARSAGSIPARGTKIKISIITIAYTIGSIPDFQENFRGALKTHVKVHYSGPFCLLVSISAAFCFRIGVKGSTTHIRGRGVRRLAMGQTLAARRSSRPACFVRHFSRDVRHRPQMTNPELAGHRGTRTHSRSLRY